jgi:hypothetical protein
VALLVVIAKRRTCAIAGQRAGERRMGSQGKGRKLGRRKRDRLGSGLMLSPGR